MPIITFTPEWDGASSRFSTKKVSWVTEIPRVTELLDSCGVSQGLTLSYSGQSLSKEDCDDGNKTDLLTWTASSYVSVRANAAGKTDFSLYDAFATPVFAGTDYGQMLAAVLAADGEAQYYGPSLEVRNTTGRLLRRYSVGFRPLLSCGVRVGAKRTLGLELMAMDPDTCEQYVSTSVRIELRTTDAIHTASADIFPNFQAATGANSLAIFGVAFNADRAAVQAVVTAAFAAGASSAKSIGSL